MSSTEAFGQILRKARRRASLSQEELADRCNLHRNAVGLIERGERSPNLDTILALAEGLQIRPSRLIAELEADLKRSAKR